MTFSVREMQIPYETTLQCCYTTLTFDHHHLILFKEGRLSYGNRKSQSSNTSIQRQSYRLKKKKKAHKTEGISYIDCGNFLFFHYFFLGNIITDRWTTLKYIHLFTGFILLTSCLFGTSRTAKIRRKIKISFMLCGSADASALQEN